MNTEIKCVNRVQLLKRNRDLQNEIAELKKEYNDYILKTDAEITRLKRNLEYYKEEANDAFGECERLSEMVYGQSIDDVKQMNACADANKGGIGSTPYDF